MFKNKLFLLFFIFISFVSSLIAQEKLKVLHLSFHKGCMKEIELLSKVLNFDLTAQFIPNLPIDQFDGKTQGNARYNISHNMAKNIWDINYKYYDSFDLIITSDTAPLSRIFLQNNFKKPLIIWVCNRFDYADNASNPEQFPDYEYFDLIRSINVRPNVKIISYTPIEHVYAKDYRKVNVWNEVIRPAGFGINKSENFTSIIPKHIDKKNTFFIPPYHNDTIFIKLSDVLSSLDIPNYCGRYAGPNDLADFKGIVHIPYAWSNLALFENWSNGLIYFIPSVEFLFQLSSMKNFHYQEPNFRKYIQHSEWYHPEHRDLFVYFDSWSDLKYKILTTNYEEKSKKILEFAKNHYTKTLNAWRKAFNEVGITLE